MYNCCNWQRAQGALRNVLSSRTIHHRHTQLASQTENGRQKQEGQKQKPTSFLPFPPNDPITVTVLIMLPIFSLLTLLPLLLLLLQFPIAIAIITIPRCPDAQTISPQSTNQLNTLLHNLITPSTYFSVFSVSLDNACPFFPDNDAQCVIRECTVEDCPDNEIPPAWRKRQLQCQQNRETTGRLNHVDRSLTGLAALVDPPDFEIADTQAWVLRDEQHRMTFVDLRKNPEQYTGYAGESAARVWQAVYDENCFTFSDKCSSGICDPDTCKEERVLYRLISGLHASISMHIAKRYLKRSTWGPNLDIYRTRLRAYPERIANLNVAYALVLRALSKASPYLHPSHFSYVTGNPGNDAITSQALVQLHRHPLLEPRCKQRVFDESDMFQNQYHLPEFRNAFRNISMIMDCVGCEKCRLWGKLQFLGLGTALNILFDDNMPDLERNQVIALYNLLYKLSTSVRWVAKMEELIKRDARFKARLAGMIAAMCVLLTMYLFRGRKKCKKETPQTDSQSSVTTSQVTSEVTKDVKGKKSTVVEDTSPEVKPQMDVVDPTSVRQRKS